eukprot:TRINITY_DN136_c1_g3_i1.p1 TRINITY_DN136_c1_g3~~TRINITY_DN136_c1_g3_i1.p1  ORF type:complete len:891 (+),score=98.61 TRINITY_DN136_c1_g3_i1:27-2675(+)
MPPQQRPQQRRHSKGERRNNVGKAGWKPDSSTRSCLGCKARFSLTLRKHHCRRCGNIFCKNCAAERRVLHQKYGYGSTPQRQCKLCTSFDEQLLEIQLDEAEGRTALQEKNFVTWQTPVLQIISGLILAATPNISTEVNSPHHTPSPVLDEPGLNKAPTTPRESSPEPVSSELLSQQRTKDLFIDPALIKAALGFVTTLSSAGTNLQRDRRLNLKYQKAIFSQPEVTAYFATSFPSVDIDVFWEILKRASVFDHVTEKCYRFNEAIVSKCKDLYVDDDTPIIVGSVVVEKSEQSCEYCVIEMNAIEGTAILLKLDSTTFTKNILDLEISPFSGVTAALPKLLCGTVLDLDGEPVELGDLRPEFIRTVLLFMKHVTHNLLGENTISMKMFPDSFIGEATVEWLTTSWDLSENDAVDFCEVLHRMGFFESVAERSVFDGTYQLFKPTPSILKSLEDTIEHVKPLTNKQTSLSSNVSGNTVLVIQPGRNRHREGHVVDGLKNGMIKVQFSNGDSWVFSDNELIPSPAVECLEVTKDEGAGLTNPAVGALARMFASGMQRHIKKIQWQGTTRYTNAFNSDDAITWLSKAFPSLSTPNAVDVLELLRSAGLFSHGSPSEADSPIKKNNYYKFQIGAMKLLDQYVVEAKGQDTDVSRILHEILVKGTARKKPLSSSIKLRRQSQPPPQSSVLDIGMGGSSMFSSPAGRRRPGSLPINRYDGFTDILKEGFLMKKSDRDGTWSLQRYVLTSDGSLERHAPRIKVISGTRLRRVPEDDGDDIWIEPASFAEVDELLTLIAPATSNGFQRVKREGVEGYIRCYNFTSIPALHSCMRTSEVAAATSLVLPKEEGDNESTWGFGLVVKEGKHTHYLCAQTKGDRDRWINMIQQ